MNPRFILLPLFSLALAAASAQKAPATPAESSAALPAPAAADPVSAATAQKGAPPATFSLPAWFPQISGTIRAKGEYQLNEQEGRFEVRNARVAFDGQIIPTVLYKAEIDLSDEGKIKMLDAYAAVRPVKALTLRAGQMRVPFSIDAHRSPHKQLFANRSFIAKQVGNVRDVGFSAAYAPLPALQLEAGLFNGSGLTDQKDYWTRSLNFSAKAQYALPFGLTLQASVQKVKPEGGAVYLYDAGATFNAGRWLLEAEYLRKHYTHEGFADVNALDAMVAYRLPLRRVFHHMSFLARFDMMDDHSDGSLALDENDQPTGALKLTDAARKRLTGGITFSFTEGINADLRLNYEKYFYDNISLAKPSERDKIVAELVIHFPYKKK